MKSTQSSSKQRDDNNTMSSPSYKKKEESVVDVSNSVCSGPVLEVDNNEHQSMEVESNKGEKIIKVDKNTYIVKLIASMLQYAYIIAMHKKDVWLPLVKLKTN